MTMSLAKRVWTASLLLPLLLLEGRSSAERDCAGLAAAGDCEFYRCLDGLLGGCGSGAYPLGFGHKYCKRFQDSKELFDVEGQRWIDSVRMCLMNMAMLASQGDHSPNVPATSAPPPRPLTCGELALTAFDSHPHCYVESGVCSTVVSSCDSFLKLIELLEFSDLVLSANVGFKMAAKQVFGVVKACPWAIISSTFICPLKKIGDSFLEGIT